VNRPTQTTLTGTASIGAMAVAEKMSPETYTIALSEAIRSSTVPLDIQRERLAQLGVLGGSADQASADELARHFTVLEALFQRFSHSAVEAMKDGSLRSSEVAERYLSGAIKAQRAALACLSALSVLRSARAPSPNPNKGEI
jgi:hypothetical protein